MTDRATVFSAILDAPDDDTPRLVFADWLDDQPSPRCRARGELIRLQCKRASLGDARTPAVVADYLAREDAILRKWAAGWIPKPLRPHHSGAMVVRGGIVTVPQLSGYLVFERGLVGRVGFDLAVWNTATAEPSQAYYADSVYAAARRCGTIFAANPLDTISVSFAGAHDRVPALHVDLKRMPVGPGGRPGAWWDVGFSAESAAYLAGVGLHYDGEYLPPDRVKGCSILQNWLIEALIPVGVRVGLEDAEYGLDEGGPPMPMDDEDI